MPSTIERIGRYAIHDEIGKGGMATVHLARAIGPMGFARTVAVKRLLPYLATDSELSLMLRDEAKVTARIQHPCVVQTVDFVAEKGELLIVMDYVHGESLARLLQRSRDRGERVDPSIAAAIVVNVLHGLHAAHEVTDDAGMPLNVVHRDVSPQNILIGVDGVARVLDFGVAKALGRAQTTREGQLKGKLAYMSPEQMQALPVDRRTDVFAVSIVFWELLTCQRLFGGGDERSTIGKVLSASVTAPSAAIDGIPKECDRIVLRGLARTLEERFATAKEMALEIERAVIIPTASRVGQWVESLSGDDLSARRRAIVAIEATDSSGTLAPQTSADAENTKSAHTTSIETIAGALRPKRTARRIFATGTLLLTTLAAAVGLLIGLRGRHAEPLPQPTAPTSSPLTPAPPEPPPSPSPSPVPSFDSNARDAGKRRVPPSKRPDAKPAPSSSSPSAPAFPSPLAPDCSNPYYFDEQGKKRYRRECLEPK